MEDPIDILEKRVRQLEAQILPKDYHKDNTDATKKTSVINLCLDTHTMIQSALSCRDAISSVLKKIETINAFLDPMAYIDPGYLNDSEGLDSEARRTYILEMYREAKDVSEKIKEFKTLKDHIDMDLSKVIKSHSKLEEIFDKNVNLYEESRKVTNDVLSSTQSYNMICQNIALIFTKLEEDLAAIEQSRVKKRVIDE